MEVVYLKDEETGKETWTYGEWTVTLSPYCKFPDVSCNDSDIDVDLFQDNGDIEIRVKGEHRHGGYEGCSAVPVYIPFRVLDMIMEATRKGIARYERGSL